jgi:hypothetical protein
VVKLRQPLDFNQKVNSSCEQQGTKKQKHPWFLFGVWFFWSTKLKIFSFSSFIFKFTHKSSSI